ncbi:phage portal protein [Planococcus kocurii]|uniref:phage portal protein n=1 Tax=Planococcus kocurii TaxID=1374 RepID=UPI003D0939D6
MGVLDLFRSRNSELESMFDFDLLTETSERVYMKRLAIEICINMIAKTISQSEIVVMENGRSIQDEFYYKFNLKPNKNMTSSFFWQSVVHKLIYDNECLIVKTDDDDFLIADNFTHTKYAMFDDTFTGVDAAGYNFTRTFKMSDVIYIPYNNENMTSLVGELFGDYGELFGRMIEYQMLNSQIRSVVDMEGITSKDEGTQKRIQTFIDKIYKGIAGSAHVVIPQQKGFKYSEHSKNGNISVDEINKVTDGFLDNVARTLGIPIPMIRGEMADVDSQRKNYMLFCINPLSRKISDELTSKFVEKEDYLKGKRIKVKTSSHESIFDIATSADKLISSSLFTANELREELGWARSDDPALDTHLITKNYQETASTETIEGGENE